MLLILENGEQASNYFKQNSRNFIFLHIHFLSFDQDQSIPRVDPRLIQTIDATDGRFLTIFNTGANNTCTLIIISLFSL